MRMAWPSDSLSSQRVSFLSESPHPLVATSRISSRDCIHRAEFLLGKQRTGCPSSITERLAGVKLAILSKAKKLLEIKWGEKTDEKPTVG
jgi:hypothetical protein